MDDEEFDQVPKTLFDGVTSIEKLGLPGILIPVSKDTRAVLCGENSFNVLIVAARFGQGRCLVFGHNGYVRLFNEGTEDKDRAQFVTNCKQWLSKGSSNDILTIDPVKALADVNIEGKILLWNGHANKDVEFMNNLCEYLQSGGGLICAATAWGWVQLRGGKPLSDFPVTYFYNKLGVKLTNSIANCPNPIPFRPELVAFKNLQQAINDLNENSDAKELYSIVGAAVKEIGDITPDIPSGMLEHMVSNINQDIVPAHSRPVKDKKLREQSQGVCNVLCLLPGIKAPDVSGFPGDFDEPPRFETDVLYTVETTTKEWFCTGYYVAAGVSIKIDVIEQKGSSGWIARIGCHSDDIRNCSEFRRWNCISICKPLTTGTIEMCSAFGGLLFLESPDENSNSITVKIHHVVLTPHYSLADSNRAETWQHQQENAQGLWADLAGNYIVFNLPSASVRQLDSAQLDRALGFWDSVVQAHHDLAGTKPKYLDRIVCDEQPGYGYMHAGYPIVTHMDISDPKANNFVFDTDARERDGSWGLFHELGHNRQKSSWTFDGTGEVTVNIFTLHAMDILCHKTPWLHEALKSTIPEAEKYISNGSKFNEWQQKPFLALLIYVQLAREYGWENYKQVFRKYEELNPKLTTSQEKIDYWITIFSQHIGQNLVPLFKFWGFPISQPTIDSLVNLPIPSITDEVIQFAPERYTKE